MGNKKILELYPWMRIGDSERYTLLDTLPAGWHDLILDMCDQMVRMLAKYHVDINDYKVLGAKEKWGALCWYDYIDNDDVPVSVRDKLSKFTDVFCERSANTCMICGRYKSRGILVCPNCSNKFN